MKRKSILILAITVSCLIMSSLIFSVIINSIIIPRKIKPLILEAIQGSTGRKADIEELSFSFTKGLTIKNLVIYDAIDKLPLRFSQIYLKIKYLPLIFRKELAYHLISSPIEGLNIYTEAEGRYNLRSKSLTTKIYIRELPLVLLSHFIKRLPLEILGGKTNLEADLKINPDKSITIEAQLPIEELSLKIYQQTLSGNINLNLHLSKSALSELMDYHGKVNILKMELTVLSLNQTIIFTGGEIDFNKDSVQVNELNFSHLNTNYNLRGEITHLAQAEMKARISSDRLAADMDLSYSSGNLNIKKAFLKLPASSLEVQGVVKDLKNLDVDMYLTGDLNTRDLEILPFKFFSEIKELSIDSELNTELHIAGRLKEWNKLNALIKIKSPSLKIGGFNFENINIKLKTAKENLDAEIESGVYGGKLKINLDRILLKDKFPFNIKLGLEDLNLKKINEISLKLTQEIAGNLAMEVSVQGNLRALKEILGEGWVEVTEGRLWELPLLKGVAGIIDIPGMEKNVFREAHGNFAIKNGAVTTRDLQFISQRLTLNARGSIYLDGRLDLSVKTQLPQETAKTSQGLDRLQDLLIRGASGFVQEVKISGTLKNPVYAVVPISIESIFQ